jgi:hypothetical protein
MQIPRALWAHFEGGSSAALFWLVGTAGAIIRGGAFAVPQYGAGFGEASAEAGMQGDAVGRSYDFFQKSE